MGKSPLPEEFVQRIFRERAPAIRRMIKGGLNDKELYIEFLRHTSIIATNGPTGLNAAVKGVGFVVKGNLLPKTTRNLRYFMGNDPSRKDILEFLVKNLYVEEDLDFTKLSSLELAKRHTYRNLAKTNKQFYYSSYPQ